MLKKTTLAVLGLSVNGLVFAGTMGPVCTPGNVTVPCEAKLWNLGVQALYLKSVSNRGYAPISTNQYDEVESDWNWGYRLEGSYHFNTGNDATVNWTHYSNSNNPTGFIGSVPVSALSIPFTVINNNRFDQVNAVLGQHVDLSAVDKMRLYAGLQYANIQSYVTNYYPIAFAPLLATSFNLFDNSDFKGAGPVLGIDYSYYLTDALSLTANGAGSILYGTTRYNAGYVAIPVNAVVSSVSGSKKTIVPSLEAKLGLNYGYMMAQGTLNIEGGYQVINYFKALQSQGLQILTNPIAANDYGLYGPYLGLKYVGNV